MRAFSIALDSLLIDTLLEWEKIQTDTMSARDINGLWHTLMRLRHEAEVKNLTVGLPKNHRLFRLAEQAAVAYFKTNYGTGPEA